jgi:hypothetical protein
MEHWLDLNGSLERDNRHPGFLYLLLTFTGQISHGA